MRDKDEPTASAKLCAACAHRAGFTPMTCGKFRDEAGNAKPCQPLRTWAGLCGPAGAAWVKAEATGSSVIAFPKLPQAGRFA